MNNLELPHSKLLYYIAELWKQKEITDDEKATLKGNIQLLSNSKELIIGDELKIFNFLEEYESDQDEEKLKDQIIKLVRPEEGTSSSLILN